MKKLNNAILREVKEFILDTYATKDGLLVDTDEMWAVRIDSKCPYGADRLIAGLMRAGLRHYMPVARCLIDVISHASFPTHERIITVMVIGEVNSQVIADALRPSFRYAVCRIVSITKF